MLVGDSSAVAKLCVVYLWLAAAAAGLAILGRLHFLNPQVILLFVFLIGVGFALNAPVWTSIVSEVVSNAELPSATILGGLQLNISGIIGPASMPGAFTWALHRQKNGFTYA